MSRNVFPPTPPPESEKANLAGQMSRGASVRNGARPMPAKLNIEKARPQERYEIRDNGRSPENAQRLGTTRTASEPRSAPTRGYSSRDGPRGKPRRMGSNDEDEEEAYPDELYDMYSGGSRNSKGNGRRRPSAPAYIEEEEDYASDYDDEFNEDDFEMVSSRPPPGQRPRQASLAGRGGSRKPDIRKIRVKVHHDDVRYIMIGTAIEFPDLVDKIREKFGVRKRFKIRVRDDDPANADMITLGDQDDLDMCIMSIKANARKERLDMGKMEVWIQEI